MRTSTRLLAPLLIPVLAFSAILFLTGSSGPGIPEDPKYHVVITRPLRVPGWRVNEAYRKDQLMTDVFNGLDEEGLDPLWFQVFEAGTSGDFTESRALVVCKHR